MQIRKRNIRTREATPAACFGIVLLFILCLLAALWVIIIATRVVFG